MVDPKSVASAEAREIVKMAVLSGVVDPLKLEGAKAILQAEILSEIAETLKGIETQLRYIAGNTNRLP